MKAQDVAILKLAIQMADRPKSKWISRGFRGREAAEAEESTGNIKRLKLQRRRSKEYLRRRSH